MSLSTFPSDISVSTTGQRSRRAQSTSTHGSSQVDAAAAAPPANTTATTTTTDTNTNNKKKKQESAVEEPRSEMLETTQLILEDLWKESRLFHSQFRETIPTFLPQGVYVVSVASSRRKVE